MSTRLLPIQWREEGKPVPDGVAFTKAGRLHITFQERLTGGMIRRLRFIFPSEITSPEGCFVEEEIYDPKGK
jgi:hypothetical protein